MRAASSPGCASSPASSPSTRRTARRRTSPERSSPRCHSPAAMRFEKWQALGNDYLIVERDRLPFALTAERVRRLCDPHFGAGADGLLELSPPTQPGFVARLRIF